MLAHSPKDRSRSPHRNNNETIVNQTNSTSSKHLSSAIQASNQNDTSSQIDTSSNDVNIQNNNNKAKKENESQLRMKNLKSFIQALINDSSSLGSTYDEQVKALENACIKEFGDISLDRIRRMIRNIFKMRKSQQSSHPTNSFLHQDHTNILPTTTTDRFNSNENNTNKKNRSNSTSNNTTPKTSDLATSSASTLSALDADFLRHAFSQQFRPSIDLSAYFSAAAVAAASNGTGSTSPLFRPNFSPSNFLQSLTAPPPPLPTTLVSSHTHTNGSYQRTSDTSTTNVNKLSKQIKLSNSEINSIKVLINAYREAASYLNRSADELEQLI
ncbi:unnamed protein product [Rotaria sp. Silwood2]|nr:unnamed protein product [Rotaria sp. Silwood2]CAF2525209.1 unnamed protein product [Rotaria sp. Silwood2]CAF2948348.1 unnamed protein product [Rotaria sp. Silwood2]CAF4005592.1 unnamed protein product [Rotaria sp. Silwood2]CAF4134946.1 unnamed protein product [Rotaria sp. Silwood2]